MIQEKGTISVSTDNIFPIIKKFLYSDHEIFLRELVSNAVDASQKLSKLASLGEFNGELGDLKITITINEKAKTITISDNGIGMTADEVKKYINQIAFSGATEFLEKYKDKLDGKEIIGHFGLGFYSAFMVSQKVELITKSYRDNAEPVQWVCEGSTEFELAPTIKKTRGTDVVLHIASDSEEFLDKNRIRGILEKYGKFLPIPIEFEEKIINNPKPLWTKSPAELTDEDYIAFYKELHPFAPDPLFWIHLNVDYPFNLTGVLYFPKLRNDFEVQKNKIQLYSRQVFITDEVKDVVPEFMLLLHGVIDSPDIPLNVSRSYLQSDSNVKKINTHITKKVADKLSEMFKKDRKEFEAKWEDIGIFVKYGALSDDKFYEKAKEYILVKNTDQKYFTLDEYKEHIQALQTTKDNQLVGLYTSDPGKQNTYIVSAKNKNYDVLLLNTLIDNHFISFLESKVEKFQLKRVDSDSIDRLIDKGEKIDSVLSDKEKEKLKKIIEKAIQKENTTIQVESLSPNEFPLLITLPEFIRRMKDMSSHGPMSMGSFPIEPVITVNANHALIRQILQQNNEEQQKKYIQQLYDLGLLSQNGLEGQALTAFIERSIEWMGEKK